MRVGLKWELFTPVMVLLEPLRHCWIRKGVATVDQLYPLAGKRVLEVGAGTGSLLRELRRYDCSLVAVEPTYFMSRVARRRFPDVEVHEESAAAMPSLPDKSVDLAVIAATLHGFRPDFRQRVYAELTRVTRDAVAVIDYHDNHNPFVAAAEWFEAGDYFNFVKVVDAELALVFPRVEKRRVHGHESVYLGWLRA